MSSFLIKIKIPQYNIFVESKINLLKLLKFSKKIIKSKIIQTILLNHNTFYIYFQQTGTIFKLLNIIKLSIFIA